MERKPLTTARSKWVAERHATILGVRSEVWRRQVGDGDLVAIVAHEPDGWHLSISFRDHRGRYTRYPRWDEIADARYTLLPDDITVAMLLPPEADYVALHDTTFHLHQIQEDPRPCPPSAAPAEPPSSGSPSAPGPDACPSTPTPPPRATSSPTSTRPSGS